MNRNTLLAAIRYRYTSDAFATSLSCVDDDDETKLSEFDKTLTSKWDQAMDQGLFRYSLDRSHQRIVPGKYRFALHMNLKRGTDRRPPEFIHGLCQPFDSQRFNFTKVKPQELMFNLTYQKEIRNSTTELVDDATCNSTTTSHNSEASVEGDGLTSVDLHPVLINVSPLEYGHVICVPDILHLLPQCLTQTAIELAIHMALLSASRYFRVGFNSLCALASVNHLHFHCWYVEERLYTESTPVVSLHRDTLYTTTEAPVPAFVLQLHNTTPDILARQVYTITSYLQSQNVAHNMFITRGSRLDTTQNGGRYSTLRVYVWPRQSVIGAKNETGVSAPFNVAVAELGGHIPMYDAKLYESLKESDVLKILEDSKLEKTAYQQICDDVVKLFQQHYADVDR